MKNDFIFRIIYLISIFGYLSFNASFAKAAKVRSELGASSSQATYSESRSSSHGDIKKNMMMDISINYVRDTKSDGATDTAGKVSIGGMFDSWIGLDLQGMFQARARNFLVGSDIRIVPVNWFFLKGGAGVYSQKQSNEMSVTPLAGTGIQADLYNQVYLVTEATYFQINSRNNVGIGIGLGLYF